MTPETGAVQQANRFDRTEVAGAFSDLGTLFPLVVAYLAVLDMDPFGVPCATVGLRHDVPICHQLLRARSQLGVRLAA